jgi:ubiquinone/menaquinone biosynthesis C-methylase UbiE
MTSVSREQVLTAQRLENWDNTADVNELLSVIPEGRILEIGCGTGRIFEDLANHLPNSSFVGLDIDDFYLNIARQKNLRNSVFIYSSAIESIFPNQTFDVVLFRDSLHEIREQLGENGVRQTLQNASCYLKYGGMIIIRDAIQFPEQTINVTFTSESTKRIFQIFTQLRNIQLPQFKIDTRA